MDGTFWWPDFCTGCFLVPLSKDFLNKTWVKGTPLEAPKGFLHRIYDHLMPFQPNFIPFGKKWSKTHSTVIVILLPPSFSTIINHSGKAFGAPKWNFSISDIGSAENGRLSLGVFFFETLHPGRLTWNLKITYLKRKITFQTCIIMFHVNLRGCNLFFLKGEESTNQPLHVDCWWLPWIPQGESLVASARCPSLCVTRGGLEARQVTT